MTSDPPFDPYTPPELHEFCYQANDLHGHSIDASLQRLRDALIVDLAKLYRRKAAGLSIQIPIEITVKDVVVRLN